jgi:hypothetical protein
MHNGIAGAIGEAPFLMEPEEIALNIACRQGVRAPLVIGGEVSDRSEIDPLGGGDEPTDGHVFDHTLLEWGHGVLLACVINPESQAVWSTTSRV